MTPLEFNPRDFLGKKRINLVQVIPNVFCIADLFTEKLCHKLLDISSKAPNVAPNSMNKYGADASSIGLDKWCKRVMQEFVVPIVTDYFPEVATLGEPYSFFVEYQKGKQQNLKAHIDAPSAITMNVCLGTTFTGGDLTFLGPRKEKVSLQQFAGSALIHRGHHMHRAEKLLSGYRKNLIMWCPES